MIHTRITEVTISVLPESSINHSTFAVKVAWRGDERYAVLHHGYCLGTDGEWDYESIPSGREDDWLATHRFTYDEAYRRAIDVAPAIKVNGFTAAEAADRSDR